MNIGTHRAGYTEWERKDIETKLKNRKIDGVVCTPTLELGIDIGSIDVVISNTLVQWGKFKQRMGRAGRRENMGYGILMLGDDPVSAWYKVHPRDYVDVENEVYINPKNDRVSKFMIPFRAKCTDEDKKNLIRKDEDLYLENKNVFDDNIYKFHYKVCI